MKKTIIAIIAGGDSSEHDVSMRSAAGISSWLDRSKYDVYTIEVRGLDWNVRFDDGTTSAVNRHDFSFELPRTSIYSVAKTIRPDFAYITIHGTPGENGILQGYFDLLHIPYSSCNLLTAAITFDKFTLNQYLKGYGVKISESLLLRKGQNIETAEVIEKIGLPCFIKPNGAGSSFGVTRCKTADDVQAAIDKAREECPEVMIESEIVGTEIANGVFRKADGEVHVLPITEVASENEFFDYDAKYNGQVTEITPARLTDDTTARVKALTKAIYTILGGEGIMRVDYIISHETAADGTSQDIINLLEINATPGMTATSFIPQQAKADGLEMSAILDEVINQKMSAKA